MGLPGIADGADYAEAKNLSFLFMAVLDRYDLNCATLRLWFLWTVLGLYLEESSLLRSP